jgi:hypothetical protein
MIHISCLYPQQYFQRGNHHLCMQMYCQSKPNAISSPKPNPPPPVESPEVAAEAKVQMSPVLHVAAAMSTLRVGSSPGNIQENHRRVDFKTTLSRQQELLRKDQQDQLRKKVMQEEQQHCAQQSSLAALYHSSRRSRNSPERKTKEQVEVPSNLPPMPLLASSRGGHRGYQSLTSSLSSSTGQHHHQSLPLPSSFTASGTFPYAPLRSSWNNEPNPHTSMTSPRAEYPRKRQHHLQDIDRSKITQKERRELPDHNDMVDQYRLCQLTRQESAMATSTQMMPPAPAPAYYGTMLNGYKRNTLALDTTSPRQHHRHVIQNALDTLQASNDRSYLTMLIQREHDKATSNPKGC